MQRFANRTLFTKDEKWMAPMNDFISTNKDRIVLFIKDSMNLETPLEDSLTMDKYLEIVHRCEGQAPVIPISLNTIFFMHTMLSKKMATLGWGVADPDDPLFLLVAQEESMRVPPDQVPEEGDCLINLRLRSNEELLNHFKGVVERNVREREALEAKERAKQAAKAGAGKDDNSLVIRVDPGPACPHCDHLLPTRILRKIVDNAVIDGTVVTVENAAAHVASTGQVTSGPSDPGAPPVGETIPAGENVNMYVVVSLFSLFCPQLTLLLLLQVHSQAAREVHPAEGRAPGHPAEP